MASIGEWGIGLHKGPVSYTITYPDPDETLLETPEALPTSEPATAQIEFTIGAGHLPTVSPAGLEYTLTAILYAAGQNTDAASQTVYYRILKNGGSVATGSASVAAASYYTWHHYNFLGVQVGDMLACKLWATSANVNWDYRALAVMLTRIGPSGVALANVSATVGTYPTLTLGAPGAGTVYNSYAHHLDNQLSAPIGADRSWGLLLPYSTFRIVRVYMGDWTQFSFCAMSGVYRPYNYKNRVPTAISFRPLTIRV